MNTTPMDAKIVDRITKLLALSKSANVHEAAAAAARAAELMLQHKLDAADLEIAAGARQAPEAVAEETLEGGEGGKRKSTTWRGMVAAALGEAFNCMSYSAYGSDRIQIIGRPSDIQTVRYLMAYLCNEIVRLCDRDWATLLADHAERTARSLRLYNPPVPNAKAWRNSFKLGAANEIRNRLMASKQETEAKAQLTQGAALVLVRQADALARVEVERIADTHNLRTSPVQISERDAYGAGERAAREIDMDASNKRGLGGGQKRLGGAA